MGKHASRTAEDAEGMIAKYGKFLEDAKVR